MHIIFRMLNISNVTPSNLIYSVLFGRSWMAPWICSTPDSKLIQRSSCDAQLLLTYVRTYIYINIYKYTQFNVGALDFWSSQNLSFPHDFAQVQNGQHCLHLSTNGFWPVKKMPKFVWILNPVGRSNESAIQMDWKIKDSNMLHLGCKVGYWIFWILDDFSLKVRFFWLINILKINSLNIPQCLWNKLLTWWCFSSSREDTWWLMVVSN